MRKNDLTKRFVFDYETSVDLEIRGIEDISFEDSMKLRGRGILIDSEQDIYSNDLPHDERRSVLYAIFGNTESMSK